jgi:AcrR family transcriptional regulator
MPKAALSSAPVPILPKPRKSDLRREAILRTAVDLFDRHGYVNTSLDDVARAVGIRREALYYYYRSRAEVLLAIIGPQTEALVEGMKAVMEGGASAPEKLELAIRNHLKRFDRHCLEMTISLRDGIMGASPEVRSAMQRVWKDYERMWTALVEQGQRDGSFVVLGEPKMVAFGILGMCNWLSRWYNPRKHASVDELIRTYFLMLTQGLLPRPAKAPASARRPAPREKPAKT